MGAVTSLVFAGRNGYKCLNQHDGTRGIVAGEQILSAMDGVAGVLNKADGAIESIFDKVGKSEALDKIVETTGAQSKIGAIAQKTINPLLCVSAGVRVLKDDDQYAALIEETSAMGTMFGVESAMRFARAAVTGDKQATTGLAGKVANALGKSDKIKNVFSKAKDWYTKLGTSSNGSTKQKLVRAGLDLLFVAGSILAYNGGKKAGELLSNRDKTEN